MGTSSSRAGARSPTAGEWTRAKRRTGALGAGRTDAAAAVGAFASAVRRDSAVLQSGARATEAPFSAAVQGGQLLGAFLGGVARQGLDQALRSMGLGELVGMTPYGALCALADRLGGSGATLDEAVARGAVVAVLGELMGDLEGEYDDVKAGLEGTLDRGALVDLLALFLCQVIHQRFLLDLGDRIDARAVSALEAARAEEEALDFIAAMVHFDLGAMDPLALDWEGAEGARLVERNLAAALALLEG